MNINSYIFNLIEQYKKATGTVNIDMNSIEFQKDFSAWLARNKVIGDIYLNMLESRGINFDTEKCAEIGKGKYDSIVTPYYTSIITPYTEGLEKLEDIGQIIKSNFNVIDNTPTIYEDKIVVLPKTINPNEINTFMTQNPYLKSNINGWSNIHNNPNYNGIILGVYGSTDDKDKESKLEELRKIRKQLDEPYVEEEIINGSHYCYMVATDILAKKRKLSKIGK